MSVERLVLCLLVPPLAVIDRGLNAVIVVAFFTVLGWVPGVIAAFGITLTEAEQARENRLRAQTHTAMQQSLDENHMLVNLPSPYGHDDRRLQTALRAAQMAERLERHKRR